MNALSLLILILFLILFGKSNIRALALLLVTSAMVTSFTVTGRVSSLTLLLMVSLGYYSVKFHTNNKINKRNPFNVSLLLLFASCIISSSYNPVWSVQKAIVLLSPLFVTFPVICRSKGKFIRQYCKYAYYFAFAFCMFGLFEAISHMNPYVSLMNKIGLYSDFALQDSVRFGLKRTYSFFDMHITNGIMSIMIFFVLAQLKNTKYLKSLRYINVLLALLAFNVLSTGSRAVILAFVVSLLAFLDRKYMKAKYIIPGVLLLLILVVVSSDFFTQIVYSIVDTDTVEGSNSDMRLVQFMVSYNTFLEKPLFGHGIDYTAYVQEMNPELLGAESLWFPTMIDMGVLGVIAHLLVFSAAVRYCLVTRNGRCVFYVLSLFILYTMTSVPGVSLPMAMIPLLIVVEGRKWNYNRKKQRLTKKKEEVCCQFQ